MYISRVQMALLGYGIPKGGEVLDSADCGFLIMPLSKESLTSRKLDELATYFVRFSIHGIMERLESGYSRTWDVQ